MRLLNLYEWIRTTPIRPGCAGLAGSRPASVHPAARRRTPDRPRTALSCRSTTTVPTAHSRSPIAGTCASPEHARRSLDRALRRQRRAGALVGEDLGALPVLAGRAAARRGQRRAPSFFIVDSKTMAPFAMSYRRKRAVMLHQVHASHLSGSDPAGPLRESRREVFEHLDGFDSVVLLTQRQRDDVARACRRSSQPRGHPEQRADLPARRPGPRGRDRARCRARVAHRPQAGGPRDPGGRDRVRPRSPGLTLDVFGDGEARPALERLIERSNHGARASCAGTGRMRASDSHRPRSCCRPRNRRGSRSCWSRRWRPAASRSATTCRTVRPTSSCTGGPGSSCRPATSRRSPARSSSSTGWPARRIARMRRAAKRAARRFSDVEVTRAWAREQRLRGTAQARGVAAAPHGCRLGCAGSSTVENEPVAVDSDPNRRMVLGRRTSVTS